jgi:hypothetical protein
MSNLWSTPLRNARPNWHDCTVPKLQWRGRGSDSIYLASKSRGFAAGLGAHTKSAARRDQAHEVSDEEEIGRDHRNRRGCYWRVVRLQLV